MDATKIGTFIAAERRAKGWTQRQLADKLQLTDKAVSRWETGKGLPDVSFLLPLAAALDVSVGELLAGESQPQPPAVQAAETRTAEQLASYTRELGPQLRRRRACTVLAGLLLFAAAFLSLQFLRLLMGGAGIHGLSVTSLLLLVVLPFVFATFAFWLLRLLCTDGLAETRAFRRASAMAVAGLWLFDLYFATAFSGCVAFPVLDFWRDPSWQAKCKSGAVSANHAVPALSGAGAGVLERRRVCVPRAFCLLDELFRVFRAGSAAAAHLAPLARGRGRRLACRVGRQCDRGYAAVCAHRYCTIPV